MGLMAMLEEVLNGQNATATPATHKPKPPLTVATVAGVAVVISPKPKTERANLRLVHTVGEHTEQEAARYVRRLQSFHDKGIAGHDAAVLANRLVKRDRQLDDRRSCGECASFYGGRCLQHKQPFGGGGIEVLHRCYGFKKMEGHIK